MIDRATHHIKRVAEIPSFSTYEERLHPYIRSVFQNIEDAKEIEVQGNNLVFYIGNESGSPSIALTSHLDKINHYGADYPESLPVEINGGEVKGAMDDSAGVGMALTLAEQISRHGGPNMLFFFSEMEESKGLKEHPELLKNAGEGYQSGMGARRIANKCLDDDIIPDEVITLDTTPLFKGDSGIALYSKHWEYNDLEPSDELIEATEKSVARFISIDPKIKLDNNTNDFLHYGEVFNKRAEKPVVSIAVEPAIYPYHQKGECVYIKDIERTMEMVLRYSKSHFD